MYFIGADAGGTKTAYILTDENRRILSRYIGASASYITLERHQINRVIGEGVEALCRMAGITVADITAAGFGFPGYGEIPGSEQDIYAACSDVLKKTSIVCECDSYIAWAGSLAMEPGVNIIAGTGANCYGVASDGRNTRANGWGAFCDEGSCRWLGERLISIFTKQADGRIVRTALYEIFKMRLNIDEDIHFVETLADVYANDAAKTAQLQMILLEAAEAGDPLAVALYNDAAYELALSAKTVAQKLNLEKGYKVSYTGGLFHAGEFILTPLRREIEASGGILAEPLFEPEMGAVFMAMRAVGKL